MSSTMLGRWIFADTSDCEVLLRTVSRQIKKENNKKEEKRNGERESSNGKGFTCASTAQYFVWQKIK